MAFVDTHSCECAKSELDLFTVPPTQTSIESGGWVEYNPISSLADGVPIEFVVSGSGQDYIDLANTQLYVRAEMFKQITLQFITLTRWDRSIYYCIHCSLK